ncbi:MAG: thioredoxin family protein [Salibacteraceae bacterium]
MKRWIVTLVLSSSFWSAYTQDLTIVQQDWAEAQKLAQQENKLVLIDFYTTWCVPCKLFDAAVKEDAAFAAGIGKHFVLLKYDAEQDAKHHLARKYFTNLYPTFVTVVPYGNTVTKKYGGISQGEGPKELFLAFLEETHAKHTRKEYLLGHDAGTEGDYPEFFTQKMNKEGRASRSELNAYWASRESIESEEDFAVFFSFGGNQKITNYFLENQESFADRFGKKDCERAVGNMAIEHFINSLGSQSKEDLKAAVDFVHQHLNNEEGQSLITQFTCEFYKAGGDWMGLAHFVENDLGTENLESFQVNSICWMIAESCESPAVIHKALNWMQPLIDAQPTVNMLDTYAWLWYRSGNATEARKYAEKAIEKGKAQELPTKSSEDLLKELSSN